MNTRWTVCRTTHRTIWCDCGPHRGSPNLLVFPSYPSMEHYRQGEGLFIGVDCILYPFLARKGERQLGDYPKPPQEGFPASLGALPS